MTNFRGTKEECQEKAKEINENADPIEFCPLIPGKCRKDCICFSKAYAMDLSGGKFAVSGFCCRNNMFEEY